MDCKFCDTTDEEKKDLIKALSNEIYPIIKNYDDKIPAPVLAAYLIHAAKEIMCNCENDYYQMLGLLTDMMTGDLVKLFEYHQNLPEKE